jgi:hypothetical protein
MYNSSFLPVDYVAPSASGSGRYLKFEDGIRTQFRIISEHPLVGWVWWTTDNKPLRVEKIDGVPSNARLDENGNPEKPKHFWAMAVWDYQASELKILEVTQSTIRKEITKYADNPEYGHPSAYDLYVTRRGKGIETEYDVVPARNNAPLTADIMAVVNSTEINLRALLSGGDPFSGGVSAKPVFGGSFAGGARLVEVQSCTNHTAAQVYSIATKNSIDPDAMTELEFIQLRDFLYADWGSAKGVYSTKKACWTAYQELVASLGEVSDREVWVAWSGHVGQRVEALVEATEASL